MYVVLLSGGSGKRLWPLSNDSRSKQYIKLIKKEKTNERCSMIQRVWSQLEDAGLSQNSLICASQGQVEIIRSQLGDVNIAIEPDRRDTFPAAALSCAYLTSKMGAGEDELVCFIPVDPYTDASYFETLKKLPETLESTGADIVLMGAKPSFRSSVYGYMIPRETENGIISIEYFKEKPSAREAGELIEKGALWNCGVFCLKIKDILARVDQYGLPDDYDLMFKKYDRFPKISFDYEILEKCEKLSALIFEGSWKDLGTWDVLMEEMSSVSVGKVLFDDTCTDSNIINELNIPVLAMGVKNLAVVASHDGILVCDKKESSKIKAAVAEIQSPPMYEERRWGTIKVIDVNEKDGYYHSTRQINLFEGQNSSYHFHACRDEVWTILEGEGEVIINGRRRLIGKGDVVKIDSGDRHAVRALKELIFIEIQFGRSIANDDLNRLTLVWDEIECK